MGSTQSFDITAALDDGRWTGFQKFVLLLVVSGIILDGFNNQIIGFAIPALDQVWHLKSSAFAPLVGATLAAMSLGTIAGGFAGDKFGRKLALVVSVFLFGLGTLATAFSSSLMWLFIFRIIGAVGLGGAMPNGTVLLAEYTPSSHRGLAISLGVVGVPLGGLIGGAIAAAILPSFGWRMLFAIGGMIPLCVGIVMVLWLPEAPRFLLAKPNAHQRLVDILKKCDVTVVPGQQLVMSHVSQSRSSFLGLLSKEMLADTLLLWSAYFFCLMAIYVMFNWLPALLSTIGFDLRASSSGLASFNFGGIAGAVLGGMAIDRFGTKVSMVSGAIAGAIMAAAIAIGLFPLSNNLVQGVVLMTVLGVFVQGVQSTLFALAVEVYPDTMRATGVGAALGLGRLGAVASALAGVFLSGGVLVFFAVIAVSMLCVAMSIFAIRRHKSSAKARLLQSAIGA